jgi:hypothetical protein
MAIHRNGITSHEGLVLGYSHETWNDSMQIASKFALVWDVLKGAPNSVYVSDDYQNTNGSYEVDATPEVQAAYGAYSNHVAEMQRLADVEREFNRVDKGKFVTVARGRKVPKGTRGQVFWIGNNGFGTSVGIITATGEKHFTALTNVDTVVASPEETETVSAMQAASLAKWKAANPYQPRYASSGHGRRVRNLAAGY